MIYIYKITDKTNEKCYIGQAKDVFARWNIHCKPESCAKMEISRQIQSKGIHNFSFEVVEMVDADSADESEIKWIAHYDSFYNGYNKTKGGTDHYLSMRLKCSKEEIVDYWDSNPYESCRAVAKHFNLHHNTVVEILKEFNRPLTHGKQRVVIRNEKTKECFEFVSRSEGAKFILESEQLDYEVRTIQKKLSRCLRFEHYTVVEYYKSKGEEIVHPHQK